MVYNFFDKDTASVGAVKSETMSKQRPSDLATQEQSEERHKTIIGKFEKRKADMQLISKFNKGFRFLLRVIDYL